LIAHAAPSVLLDDLLDRLLLKRRQPPDTYRIAPPTRWPPSWTRQSTWSPRSGCQSFVAVGFASDHDFEPRPVSGLHVQPAPFHLTPSTLELERAMVALPLTPPGAFGHLLHDVRRYRVVGPDTLEATGVRG